MLTFVLFTLYIIACVILILVVLLQPGKGDVASALGGGTSGAAFGPRGATTLLAKVTIGSAITFMTLAFLFGVPGIISERSVTSGVDAAAPEALPAPAPAPAEGAGEAIPAGTIELEDGKMKTEAPAQPEQAPAPESKAPESKAPETKAPAEAPAKQP